MATPMPDVQNQSDSRGIAIDQVGVSDLRYPITVLDIQAGKQNVAASLTMSVSLPHHFKGTHMSRFIEALNEHSGEVTMRTLPVILNDLKTRLDAECAQIELAFTYFLERTAPVSGAKALMDYECSFRGEVNGNAEDFVLGVQVPIGSLCPCSKEISDYGAHNQRGQVQIQVRSGHNDKGLPHIIWIEELVEIAESAASSPVYPLLKRSDERQVTMRAYDNPAFVEDIVRAVAAQSMKDDRVAHFEARVTNFESIHNHNAFARVSWHREERAALQI